MTTAERMALRGVVRNLVRQPERFRTDYNRDPIGPLWDSTEQWGTCKWCGLPADTKRRKWHTLCARYYRAARGLVTDGNARSLLPRGTCSLCDKPGSEIDHSLPLSVGFEMGHRWSVRARLLDNLQWLCRPHHLEKTARDRRLLAGLKQPNRIRKFGLAAGKPGQLVLR